MIYLIQPNDFYNLQKGQSICYGVVEFRCESLLEVESWIKIYKIKLRVTWASNFNSENVHFRPSERDCKTGKLQWAQISKRWIEKEKDKSYKYFTLTLPITTEML